MRALPFFLIALAACDTVGSDGPPSIDAIDPDRGVEVADAGALEDARRAWDDVGLEDYRLRYEVICFCAPLVVDLHVEGGRVVEAWQNGEPIPDDPVSDVYTIDRLFDLAAQGFAEADGVSVRVLEVGAGRRSAVVPVAVYVDWEELVADEEVGYRVVGFEAG